MTIFQLIQKPQLRGAEMFACQLSGHLEKLGHKVILIALFPGAETLPFKGKIIQLNRPISRRWFDYNGWKELSLLVQQYQPDIIQCNAGDTLKFAVLTKLLFKWNTPIIARNASMVSLYIKGPISKWVNRQFYKNVKSIISVSEHSKRDINKIFPETFQKTTVIPVGIEIISPQKVDWIGGIEAKTHLIHVGGFSFEKNHAGLLSIFKKFIVNNPDAHLHLFGEGPKKVEMQQLIAELQLSDKVTFYGWVSNPIDYIAKADILVLPSIIEGLPGVILEAMSVKTPVIAYNVGGISEVVFNNETGYLIPKNEEGIFVEVMEKMLHNDNQYIVQKAYSLVIQQYTNLATVMHFERVYFKILNYAD